MKTPQRHRNKRPAFICCHERDKYHNYGNDVNDNDNNMDLSAIATHHTHMNCSSLSMSLSLSSLSSSSPSSCHYYLLICFLLGFINYIKLIGPNLIFFFHTLNPINSCNMNSVRFFFITRLFLRHNTTWSHIL